MLDKITAEDAVYYPDDGLICLNKKVCRYDGTRLENVEVIFHDEGFIEVHADIVVQGYKHGIYSLDGDLPNIDLIEDRFIKTKTFGFFTKKRKKVIKDGWYNYKKRKKLDLYSSSLTIKEGSGNENEL